MIGFLIGLFVGFLIPSLFLLATFSDKTLRTIWSAKQKKKPIVLLIRPDKKVEIKTLEWKDGNYHIDENVVRISPSHMFILDKTPLLIYYSSFASSIPLEVVYYIQEIKKKFSNIKDLLKYQYEEEILKLPKDLQESLWYMLENDRDKFIQTVKDLNLKPKEGLFEFLIDSPIYDFESLLNFTKNMKLDYFNSAIEKKILAKNLLNNFKIPTGAWVVIMLVIVGVFAIIAIKYLNPPTEKIVINTCQNMSKSVTNSTITF